MPWSPCVPRPDGARYPFGAVGISCIDLAGAIDALYEIAADGSGGYFAFTCAHGIIESQQDARLRDVLNGSRLTLPDGMPTVWLGRLKGRRIARVAAPDFMEAALSDPRAGTVRHYFYGAAPATLERVLARARGLAGAHAIVGAHSPPLRAPGAPEDLAVIEAIAATRPQVIWVGLGLPKQELWMSRYAPELPGAVMLGVGAAFDWFAGVQPRAPRAVQALGLEWLHRVVSEPRRLGPRYGALLVPAARLFAREVVGQVSTRGRARN